MSRYASAGLWLAALGYALVVDLVGPAVVVFPALERVIAHPGWQAVATLALLLLGFSTTLGWAAAEHIVSRARDVRCDRPAQPVAR